MCFFDLILFSMFSETVDTLCPGNVSIPLYPTEGWLFWAACLRGSSLPSANQATSEQAKLIVVLGLNDDVPQGFSANPFGQYFFTALSPAVK